MPRVFCLPSSNSNRAAAYARAEYLDARGRRRVLVWNLDMRRQGRGGTLSLRENRGALDLPGTRRRMSGDAMMQLLVSLEATGRLVVGDDVVEFPDDLRTAFVERCRARMEDARTGTLSTTPAVP